MPQALRNKTLVAIQLLNDVRSKAQKLASIIERRLIELCKTLYEQADHVDKIPPTAKKVLTITRMGYTDSSGFNHFSTIDVYVDDNAVYFREVDDIYPNEEYHPGNDSWKRMIITRKFESETFAWEIRRLADLLNWLKKCP